MTMSHAGSRVGMAAIRLMDSSDASKVGQQSQGAVDGHKPDPGAKAACPAVDFFRREGGFTAGQHPQDGPSRPRQAEACLLEEAVAEARLKSGSN
jgi:hypothetical protein